MAEPAQTIQIFGFSASVIGDFGQQAAAWSAFFSAVAQVSGGLVGLVFVALTFNGKLAASGSSMLRDLARQTFADFLAVLMVSLVLLVPNARSLNVATMLLIFGAIGVFRIGHTLVSAVLRRRSQTLSWQVTQRFILSLSANVLLLIAGLLVTIQPFRAEEFWSSVFASIVIFLISGSRSAWMLVVQEPEGER